ncbi:MAG: Ig-like domain-containing protein [Chloroflexota bacterium]
MVAHLTIDEPQDCQDWNGVCPTQTKVDQAAEISKQYWPNLMTFIHTMPDYASEYDWVDTDLIHFQYAYHKGDLTSFIDDTRDMMDEGHVGQISWAIQALAGGCEEGWGICSMTPAQVWEVGTAMCNTNVGFTVTYERYDETLIDAQMQQTIDNLIDYCATPPAPTPTPPGTRVHVGDLDGWGTRTGTTWKATVVITVHDQNENPRSGVTVSGSWANGDTATCGPTGSNGQCTVVRQYLPNSVTKSILTITNLSGYPYDWLANHDPDGSSDGTVIWVYKP